MQLSRSVLALLLLIVIATAFSFTSLFSTASKRSAAERRSRGRRLSNPPDGQEDSLPAPRRNFIAKRPARPSQLKLSLAGDVRTQLEKFDLLSIWNGRPRDVEVGKRRGSKKRASPHGEEERDDPSIAMWSAFVRRHQQNLKIATAIFDHERLVSSLFIADPANAQERGRGGNADAGNVARMFVPRTAFIAERRAFASSTAASGPQALFDKYAALLRRSLEALTAEEWQVDGSAESALEKALLHRLAGTAVPPSLSFSSPLLVDDASTWQRHFGADSGGAGNSAPPAVLVTVATNATAPMLCGFAAAVARTSSVIFLFVPFGSTEQDVAAFERLVDGCASAAAAAASPPMVLFHRSVLEADRDYASKRLRLQQQQAIVLDQREAEEAWIELGVAVRSRTLRASAPSMRRQQRQDRIGPFTRFAVRNAVDPDFFSLRGANGTSVAFDRSTQTLVVVAEDELAHAVFRDSAFALFRRTSAADAEVVLRNFNQNPPRDGNPVFAAAVRAALADLRANDADSALLASLKEASRHLSSSSEFADVKLRKKQRKIGRDLGRVRFAYRDEESDAAMRDLRVLFVRRNETAAGAIAQLLVERDDDDAQRALFRAVRARGESKHRAHDLVRDLMQKQQENFDARVAARAGSSDFGACCSRVAITGGVAFMTYPWTRDNVYHTFNDNFLPLVLAALRVSPAGQRVCPVGTDAVDAASGRSLCADSRSRHLLLLPSTRSNKPLPVYDSLARAFAHSVIDLTATNASSTVAASASCPDFAFCMGFDDRRNELVFGRPPRPFSANFTDVAAYLDADVVFHLRFFLKLQLFELLASKRPAAAAAAGPAPLRVVLLERRSKRRLLSDAAFAAVLATRITEAVSPAREVVFTTIEGLPFEQQVALVAGADVLVGVHGAGLLHALWMGMAQSRSPSRARSPLLVVHVASRRLNFHEQTVIERLALFASHALKRELLEEVVPIAGAKRRFSVEQTQQQADDAAPAVRFMTTFTVTDSHGPSHWSDDFDLPLDDVDAIASRVAQVVAASSFK